MPHCGLTSGPNAHRQMVLCLLLYQTQTALASYSSLRQTDRQTDRQMRLLMLYCTLFGIVTACQASHSRPQQGAHLAMKAVNMCIDGNSSQCAQHASNFCSACRHFNTLRHCMDRANNASWLTLKPVCNVVEHTRHIVVWYG